MGTGPLRVLLQEGSTVWLATGATLVRAKLNQLRPCTEREQLVVSTQGATIHQTAVGLDTLLKNYRGKHFLDASGETPGDELEENLEPAEVRVEPPAPEQRADRDVWEQRPGMLVRVHNVMRLSLFSPLKMKDLPVPEDQLTGQRRTIIRGPEGLRTIVDDFRKDPRPSRALMERWRGETQLELKVPGDGEPALQERPAPLPERVVSPQERPAPLPERVVSPQERLVPVPSGSSASSSGVPEVPVPSFSPVVSPDEEMEPETPVPPGWDVLPAVPPVEPGPVDWRRSTRVQLLTLRLRTATVPTSCRSSVSTTRKLRKRLRSWVLLGRLSSQRRTSRS